MSNLNYICREEHMRQLDVIDAHLHILSSLSSAITDSNYPLDIKSDKLATLLYSLSNDLSDTLTSMKACTNIARKSKGGCHD